MVTFWLLIDTIAMIASPAWRGAVASADCAGRAFWAAASAGGAAVSAHSVARAASLTMAEGHHSRIAHVDSAVANRSVMPCPPLIASAGPCKGELRRNISEQ